jgi:hypothetical protein
MLQLQSKPAVPTIAAVWLLTLSGCCGGWLSVGRNSIPDRYPLGSVNRAHYHAMETNAEATDFIFNRNEFVGETSELTSDGKDHLLEVGARMRSAPFPVIVERSENNSNPALDAERRNGVAQYLGGLGNTDSEQRTFVATPYSLGYNGIEGVFDTTTFYMLRAFGGVGFGGIGFSGLGFGGLGGMGGGMAGGWAGSGFGFGP